MFFKKRREIETKHSSHALLEWIYGFVKFVQVGFESDIKRAKLEEWYEQYKGAYINDVIYGSPLWFTSLYHLLVVQA